MIEGFFIKHMACVELAGDGVFSFSTIKMWSQAENDAISREINYQTKLVHTAQVIRD